MQSGSHSSPCENPLTVGWPSAFPPPSRSGRRRWPGLRENGPGRTARSGPSTSVGFPSPSSFAGCATSSGWRPEARRPLPARISAAAGGGCSQNGQMSPHKGISSLLDLVVAYARSLRVPGPRGDLCRFVSGVLLDCELPGRRTRRPDRAARQPRPTSERGQRRLARTGEGPHLGGGADRRRRRTPRGQPERMPPSTT